MEYYEFYNQDFKKKSPEKKKKVDVWKLVWKYGGKEKEELIRGKYSLCRWKMNQVQSQYTIGELKIVPAQ